MTTPQILVIDNYDSFVYNLVQYVGESVQSTGGWAAQSTDGESVQSTGGWAAQSTDGESVQSTGSAVIVRRNDAIDASEIRELDPDGIVVSPGPGTPESAGVSMDIFDLAYPTLGVCLGHQALCAQNGAPVGQAEAVVHGKPSKIHHDGEGVFEGLSDGIHVGRYHSLAVERSAIPDCLVETATTNEEDTVMAVRHREKPHVGVQFHPESILTGHGKTMVRNFLRLARRWEQ